MLSLNNIVASLECRIEETIVESVCILLDSQIYFINWKSSIVYDYYICFSIFVSPTMVLV